MPLLPTMIDPLSVRPDGAVFSDWMAPDGMRLRRMDYDAAALTHWAARIRAQRWQQAFVFFKHEEGQPLGWPAIERFLASVQ